MRFIRLSGCTTDVTPGFSTLPTTLSPVRHPNPALGGGGLADNPSAKEYRRASQDRSRTNEVAEGGGGGGGADEAGNAAEGRLGFYTGGLQPRIDFVDSDRLSTHHPTYPPFNHATFRIIRTHPSPHHSATPVPHTHMSPAPSTNYTTLHRYPTLCYRGLGQIHLVDPLLAAVGAPKGDRPTAFAPSNGQRAEAGHQAKDLFSRFGKRWLSRRRSHRRPETKA